MVSIKMDQGWFKLEFKANSTREGFAEAIAKYNRLGLIGRCYVTSSEGKFITINQ